MTRIPTIDRNDYRERVRLYLAMPRLYEPILYHVDRFYDMGYRAETAEYLVRKWLGRESW